MMLPLRYARHWQGASVALLLLVLVATLMPVFWLWPDRAQLASWFRNLDKWAHLATFALLAVWFAGQYRPRSYWRIGLGLFAFGVLIEVCQRMVGYRSADLMDIGANTLGIVSGLAIALAGLGGWCMLFEAWYAGRRAGAQID
jgi:VanZ family protein